MKSVFHGFKERYHMKKYFLTSAAPHVATPRRAQPSPEMKTHIARPYVSAQSLIILSGLSVPPPAPEFSGTCVNQHESTMPRANNTQISELVHKYFYVLSAFKSGTKLPGRIMPHIQFIGRSLRMPRPTHPLPSQPTNPWYSKG